MPNKAVVCHDAGDRYCFFLLDFLVNNMEEIQRTENEMLIEAVLTISHFFSAIV
jgi:hypothetical protein